MGEHFALLDNRLLTESTLEAAIECRDRSLQVPVSIAEDMKFEIDSKEWDIENPPIPVKVVECRICQDEDLDINMEAPCSCCGSLKYAHRRCIQKWCNEKGDTICEICCQQFTPNYIAPPPLFQLGRIPLNFRGSWTATRRDVHGARVVAVVAGDRAFINADYEDHSFLASRTISICRTITLALMILLLLRHAFPVFYSVTSDISIPFFLLLILRSIAIIAPILVMARLATAVLHRRQRESVSSDEEIDDLH